MKPWRRVSINDKNKFLFGKYFSLLVNRIFFFRQTDDGKWNCLFWTYSKTTIRTDLFDYFPLWFDRKTCRQSLPTLHIDRHRWLTHLSTHRVKDNVIDQLEKKKENLYQKKKKEKVRQTSAKFTHWCLYLFVAFGLIRFSRVFRRQAINDHFIDRENQAISMSNKRHDRSDVIEKTKKRKKRHSFLVRIEGTEKIKSLGIDFSLSL